MIGDTLFLIAELVGLFLSVAFLVHISQRWLGTDRLRRLMGGTPAVAALKGIGVGFITPFCAYSAIPMLVGLRRAGVSPAGYVAFIVAAPILDPILFGALVLIVGLQAALIYLVVAFTAAMAMALVAERLDITRFMKPLAETVNVPGGRVPARALTGEVEVDDSTCGDSCDPDMDRPWQGLRAEASEAGASALSLLRSLGPILLLGVAAGVIIELFVPADFVASVAGNDNPFAIPVAAGLGTPLYFNTELFIPIADSLASVGVGIGAIVALTIAGAGANLPEFVILSKLTRANVLAIFIGYVFLVAITGGLLAKTLA